MKESRTRNRFFSAILYPDDENYSKYINNIQKYQELTYIKHDRDIDENGEIKKTHYHFLFKVGENARTLKSVAEEIGIAENYLQGCNKKAMLMYLIHLNNPEKTQYGIEEVWGEGQKELKKIIENRKEEEERIEPIIKKIQTREIYTLNDLVIYGITNNKLNLIKKYQYILVKLIEENRYRGDLERRTRSHITKILQNEEKVETDEKI